MEVDETGSRGGKHISKRALRNKSLSISFNEKDLRDYVGGFHKRKKKRRKEALKQQEEKERRRRLAERKRRRKEKEYALFGGAPPEDDAKSGDEDVEQNEETTEKNVALSGTTSYENGDMTVTVTTSEISREEEYPIRRSAPVSAVSSGVDDKKQNISVKKKPFKKPSRGNFRPKLSRKIDKRKAKVNGNKRKR